MGLPDYVFCIVFAANDTCCGSVSQSKNSKKCITLPNMMAIADIHINEHWPPTGPATKPSRYLLSVLRNNFGGIVRHLGMNVPVGH